MGNKVYDTLEFEVKNTYYQKDLGVMYSKSQTVFKLWSPLATQVEVVLYNNENELVKIYELVASDHGTFKVVVKDDLEHMKYRFRATFDQVQTEFVDPYAKAVDTNGEYGVIVDLIKTNPDGWLSDVKPTFGEMTEAIIYEVHVRDISIHESSGISLKGKFLGLTETNTVSSEGLSTGLDHLKDLGVTHVHLLPSYDFGSIDESRLDEPQFNWGYDPVNYNAVEGSYSTDPSQGEVRIREFKQLVKAFHEAGIRVIMDVVYNHTHHSEDSNLNKAVPGYYYRFDEEGNFSNGSGCGNELASERSMCRRYIVDSVSYFAREYHIDGFRFDLMGLHDIKTMNEVRQSLNEIDESIIIYGEGWACDQSPLPFEESAMKVNVSKMPGIAVFSDDARDGIKGHVFYEDEPGFVNGGIGFEDSVKFTVVAGCEHPQVNYEKVIYADKPWATDPNQCVNYVECHDNLTLFDKLEKSAVDSTLQERIKMHKLANGIVFTSQGIAFMHAGSEMLRTKFGIENSYNSPDEINQFVWSRKYEHYDVYEYYKNLIALRKAHKAFTMPTTEMIQEKVMFLTAPEQCVAYMLKEHANGDEWRNIVVVYNASKEEAEITLPMMATWHKVVDDNQASVTAFETFEDQKVCVAPLSMGVYYTDDKYVDSVAKLKLGAKIAAGVAGGVVIGALLYKAATKTKE